MPKKLALLENNFIYYPNFIQEHLSWQYFHSLADTIPWKHESIILFGKEVMQPRLTSFFADSNVDYAYSGRVLEKEKWSNLLFEIKYKIENELQHYFNSCLLNFYRSGNDSMGWHRDNESSLGSNPMIASLSLGGSRKFKIRKYKEKKEGIDLNLNSGDLLLMQNDAQLKYEHAIPKTKKVVSERINLTFRTVMK